jgi:hypothetical protein
LSNNNNIAEPKPFELYELVAAGKNENRFLAEINIQKSHFQPLYKQKQKRPLKASLYAPRPSKVIATVCAAYIQLYRI